MKTNDVDLLGVATTCAEIAQIHEKLAEGMSIQDALKAYTELKVNISMRDLHYFYRNDSTVAATLMALAVGHKGLPPHVQSSSSKAVHNWITVTPNGMHFLTDSTLASVLYDSNNPITDTSGQVAKSILWDLIPIASCLGN